MALNASGQYRNIEEVRVTLSADHLSLDQFFSEVQRQTPFKFSYEHRDVNRQLTVTFAKKEGPVIDFLKEAAQQTNLSFRQVNHGIDVLKRKGSGQVLVSVADITITGRVVDDKGDPLPGASVSVVGTTTGTVTDIDGNYTILVPEGATLIFSYIGFESMRVAVDNRSQINVTLNPDMSSLDEVVVIGYGTVKKSDLTGSVSQIKSETISAVTTPRLDQALQGKAAGVQVTSLNGEPGTGTSIRIRGGNSINASNEPLFVIDGFIGGGDLNSINVNDVESIEILKDASATSIYGARGANGVILVTTKRGKEGVGRVNVNSYYGIQTLAGKIDFLKGPDRAAYAKEHQEHLNQAVAFPDPSSVSHTDWQEVMTNDAPIKNTDISFSGGNKSIKYFLSGNYFNQEGLIVNSGFERYQQRLNLDADIFDWLTVGTTLNISRTARNNNKVDFYTLLKDMYTTTPVYKEDGSYNDYNSLIQDFFPNMLETTLMTKDNTFDTRFLGNYYLSANFQNGLSIRSTIGADLNYSKTNLYLPGELPARKDQNRGGYARISNSTSREFLNENTISYMKDFENHSINLLGGATYQNSQRESLWASGDGFSNDVLEYNRLSTGNPLLRNSDSGFSDWTMISFLGRANYIYNEKYLFTLTGRYDGSSRLAANNKWAFFPSAAVAWRLIEEDFIKETGIFSDLKLRASYGKTGNQAIGIYSTLPSLQVNRVFFNNSEWVAYRSGNIPNPDLRWETTDQLDLGLEGGFFDGKLSFEFDYYYKRTKDLLLEVEIPRQTGYASRLINIGEVENKGVELFIRTYPITTNNFSWELSFNIAANRNKVLDLGGKDFIDVGKGARLIVGEPAIVFYGLVYDGTWKSQEEIDASNGFMANVQPGYPKFKDVDGNGKFERTSDREILGTPQPDFYGGIESKFRYKNLELDLFFTGTYGNEIYSEFGPRLFYGGFASNIHAMALNRWTVENNTSDIPRAGSVVSVNMSDTHSTDVQDGSFLRLQTFRFAYNIITKNIAWLNRAQVYVAGNNLFILHNYDWGNDPEVNSQGTHSILRGYDGYTYPNNRSFSVGINVEF
ncbi:SusC/RagA family TonB-linked outer membrane protein [Aquiflexum sp.]|uniref:SusC/RagA family TonB-linked outer membrane protein n=1 Tax=Aquiflexum sp. TaxID=1872584 RepID=UPI003593E5E7